MRLRSASNFAKSEKPSELCCARSACCSPPPPRTTLPTQLGSLRHLRTRSRSVRPLRSRLRPSPLPHTCLRAHARPVAAHSRCSGHSPAAWLPLSLCPLAVVVPPPFASLRIPAPPQSLDRVRARCACSASRSHLSFVLPHSGFPARGLRPSSLGRSSFSIEPASRALRVRFRRLLRPLGCGPLAAFATAPAGGLHISARSATSVSVLGACAPAVRAQLPASRATFAPSARANVLGLGLRACRRTFAAQCVRRQRRRRCV